MKECLDEGTLQSYFDGELAIHQMESATVHLSQCVTCAAMARELEEETAVLTAALAAEFEAPVPTELLRQRIDAAVANLNAPVVEKSSFFGSLSGFFSFAPQRALGYASLVVVLAFAAIFGVVKMRTGEQPEDVKNNQVAVNNKAGVQPQSSESYDIPAVIDLNEGQPVPPIHRPAPSRPAPKPAPVKLLPGERAYLKTIARLDSAIKADKNTMRPALQVEYERNLAVVDHAIAATRTAAKNNPNDPDAADFMFAAYQSKVDLLNTIADARVRGRSH